MFLQFAAAVWGSVTTEQFAQPAWAICPTQPRRQRARFAQSSSQRLPRNARHPRTFWFSWHARWHHPRYARTFRIS